LTGIEELDIQVCPIHPAAVQLLRRGLFPCAPKRPSIAFDINLLDLIELNSLFAAPNVTGWAATVEAYLKQRGHTLRTEVRPTKPISVMGG
jgi:hypothetical protein